MPHRYLARPRLITDLDGAGPGQLTLVSAPAGYGKTLMLAEWATRSPQRTAWVSLDGDDNDDRRFWSAVLSALVACPALHATNALHELEVPAGPSADPAFLATITNALAGAGDPSASSSTTCTSSPRPHPGTGSPHWSGTGRSDCTWCSPDALIHR